MGWLRSRLSLFLSPSMPLICVFSTPNKQISVLRDRLKERGASFKGSVPTNEEIKEAEEATMLRKDLEGIDTSNIVEAGSRRRAAREGAYGNVEVGSAAKKKKKIKVAASPHGSSSSEDELEL